MAKKCRSKKHKSYPFAPEQPTKALEPEQTYDDKQVAGYLRLKSWKSMSALRSRGLHPFSRVPTIRGAGKPLYFGRDLIAYFNGEKPRARRAR